MSASLPRNSRSGSPQIPESIWFTARCKLDASGSASLELAGELDRAFSAEFESCLAQAQRHSLAVTLDLQRLTYIDSAGYGVLVAAAASSRPGAKLILVGCTGQVQRLLDTVDLPANVELDRPVRQSSSGHRRMTSPSRFESGAAAGV